MRLARRLLLTLVVLALILVLADRATLWFAENQVAHQMQQAMGFAREPDVAIEGFPFLTQLVARRFGELHITGRDLSQAGGGISQLDMTLHGVRPLGQDSVRIDSIGGTALLTFADLARASGNPGTTLAAADGDRVRVTTTVNVFGTPVPASGTGQVLLVGGDRIAVRVIAIDGLTPDQNQQMSRMLNFTVPIAGLPQGLTLSRTQVLPEGIEVGFDGHDVDLRSPQAGISP